jgi:CIC family chloride channel protein
MMERGQWHWMQSWLDRLSPPKGTVLVVTAISVGILTALSAVSLIWLIAQIALLIKLTQSWLGETPGLLLIMAISGLCVGILLSRFSPESKGYGVSAVMESVAMSGGRIRPRVAPIKFLASALTLGAGGSAGREGPMVQIGAALGSTIGQYMHLSVKRVRILVACGTAAGIASAFNAPIAGTIFALEVILASFTVRYFGVVVISSVSASVIAQSFIGRQPAFSVPPYGLNHASELLIYLVLAILTAIISVVFMRGMSCSEKIFAKIRLPLVVNATIGMLLTGLLAYTFAAPQVLGQGLDFIGKILSKDFHSVLSLLAMLLLLKILATALTLGSGNSGGIVAPSLFIGAVLGAMVGSIAHKFWPNIAVNPGSYAIVGMAGIFAGTARAPMTAILIVFEMSGSYQLILPLMLVAVLSTYLAERIIPQSIYADVLKNKGIILQEGRDLGILHGLNVEEIMQRDFVSVSENDTISSVSNIFAHTHWHSIMVLDEQQKFWGIVAISDVDRAIANRIPLDTLISAIATPAARTQIVQPEETMGDALHRMGVRGFSILPVISPEDPHTLVGIVRRSEIISAYNTALSRRSEIEHRARYIELQEENELEYFEICLIEGDKAIGQSLKQLAPKMPPDCILISVRRDNKLLIPHGNTIFRKGDLITAYIHSDAIDQLYAAIKNLDG